MSCTTTSRNDLAMYCLLHEQHHNFPEPFMPFTFIKELLQVEALVISIGYIHVLRMLQRGPQEPKENDEES